MPFPFPYDLPIFRSSHREVSRDGALVASIEQANEVSMGNPTSGELVISSGMRLFDCSPSFIWSDDSRFLAAPQFYLRFGVFRRQRLVIVDAKERRAYASKETTYYFQPESFADGTLDVRKNPHASKATIRWRIPEDLATKFSEISL